MLICTVPRSRVAVCKARPLRWSDLLLMDSTFTALLLMSPAPLTRFGLTGLGGLSELCVDILEGMTQ